jgi:hypothetical protein
MQMPCVPIDSTNNLFLVGNTTDPLQMFILERKKKYELQRSGLCIYEKRYKIKVETEALIESNVQIQ